MTNTQLHIAKDRSLHLEELMRCETVSEIEAKGLLAELELFELFEVRENPDFLIEEHFVLDRQMDLWPEISIHGSRLYRSGQKIGAYEKFSKIKTQNLGTSIPQWSQGAYGMSLIPKVLDRVEILDVKNAFTSQQTIFCVSFDKNYLNYAKIYATQANRLGLCVALIYCYSNEDEINEIATSLLENSISLFAVKTPDGLNERNKKGFFTLARYILAQHLLKKNMKSVVVTDVDAIIKNPDCLGLIPEESDMSCLALNRWGRPWLKNTAPFLMVRDTEAGHQFMEHIVNNINSRLHELSEGIEISLWGVDQAAITSAIDYLEIYNPDFKTHNFIKNVKNFMEQAQELGSKAEFVKKYINQSSDII